MHSFGPLSYFIIADHDLSSGDAIRYLNTVFSFLLISAVVSGKQFCYMIFFPQRETMFTCVAHQLSLGGPAKWTANGPAWTGSAKSGLFVWDALFFPSSSSPPPPSETTDLTMAPFFIFNELTNLRRCFNKEIQSAIFIHHTTQTNKKETNPQSGLRGITMEYEDKRDMTQCCFYNWFASPVRPITVHRNPITANCSSKHEHLARNDSTSFTLRQFFRTSL